MIYYILASNLITTLYQVSLSSPRQSRHPSSAPAPRPPRQHTRARCRLGVLQDRCVLHLCPLCVLVLKRRDCQHSYGEPGALLVLTSMTRSCVWPGGAGALSGAIKCQFLSRHPRPARPALNENDRPSRLVDLWSITSPPRVNDFCFSSYPTNCLCRIISFNKFSLQTDICRTHAIRRRAKVRMF